MSLGASKKGDSMITQTAEIDEATRPSGLDMALESSTSFPGQQPSPPLRVFISYKEKDRAATLDIKRVLLKIGGGNIRVFVSGDEPAGIQWREGVLNELRKCSHLDLPLHRSGGTLGLVPLRDGVF